MPTRIASRDLRPEHVPDARTVLDHDGLAPVLDFAHTFNGYAWGGGPTRMRGLVEDLRRAWEETGDLPAGVDPLRACLFWWARTRQHEADPVSEADRTWVAALLDGLRARVAGDGSTG